MTDQSEETITLVRHLNSNGFSRLDYYSDTNGNYVVAQNDPNSGNFVRGVVLENQGSKVKDKCLLTAKQLAELKSLMISQTEKPTVFEGREFSYHIIPQKGALLELCNRNR